MKSFDDCLLYAMCNSIEQDDMYERRRINRNKVRVAREIHKQRTIYIMIAAIVALAIISLVANIIEISPNRETKIVYYQEGKDFTTFKPKPIIDEEACHTIAAEMEFGYNYEYVERVVMAEAGAESFELQMMIAQCIRNSCKGTTLNPEEVCIEYGYTSPYRGEVSESVKEACRRIFMYGETIIDEDIKYFYSERGGFYSVWHEGLEYCFTQEDVKFFKS